MAEIATIKYRAFLSYSHRDTSGGKWLHSALEGYRIDKDIVGRQTPVGPVPKTLRPIFRDREDFSAGHSLTAQTLAALEASQFLIVLCSPNAARSRYVNEEIRRFKVLGRADRIIPVIVDGDLGDPVHECFPPALRFKLDANGQLTDKLEEPIAADARPQRDGKHIALAKIVAGLLSVGLDEIVRRAERARKRRTKLLTALSCLFLTLGIFATGSAIYAYQKLVQSEERLDQAIEIAYGFVSEATALSDRFGIPADLTFGLLKRAETALNNLISKGGATESLEFRKSLMLTSFSEAFIRVGQIDDALDRAISATTLLRNLISHNPKRYDWQFALLKAERQSGDVFILKREVSSAVDSYRAAIAAGQQLLKSNQAFVEHASYIVMSHINIGDALASSGALSEARQIITTP